MNKIRLINLESEGKTQAGSTGKAQKELGFKEKARRGHFGDLRLLGLSAGLVLLMILVGLFQSGDASTVAANPALEEAAVSAPPVFSSTAEEAPNIAVSTFDEFEYSGMDPDDSLAIGPDERTHEQREQLRREMAEDIPEGETLIW
jgi:hypothetical protein